jgi:hypothetical protein
MVENNEVSLRDYMEARFKSVDDKLIAQSKYIEQHFELNELAIEKAEESMLQRLESMNEFRAQIKDERGSYASKEMVESIKLECTDYATKELVTNSTAAVKESLASTSTALDKRIKALENANSFSAGKLWMFMALFAAIPTILALIALFRKST